MTSCDWKLAVEEDVASRRIVESKSKSGRARSAEHPLPIIHRLPLLAEQSREGLGVVFGNDKSPESTSDDSVSRSKEPNTAFHCSKLVPRRLNNLVISVCLVCLVCSSSLVVSSSYCLIVSSPRLLVPVRQPKKKRRKRVTRRNATEEGYSTNPLRLDVYRI